MEPFFEVMRTALFICSSANGRMEPRASANSLVIGTMGSSRKRLSSLSLLFNIGKPRMGGPVDAAVSLRSFSQALFPVNAIYFQACIPFGILLVRAARHDQGHHPRTGL